MQQVELPMEVCTVCNKPVEHTNMFGICDPCENTLDYTNKRWEDMTERERELHKIRKY